MNEKKKTVVALGGFDGLHKAHRKLIEKTKEYAKEHGILSGVLLFDKLPSEVFLENAKRIMKLSDKKALLDDVDFLYEQKFDTEFMSMSDEDFAKFLVDKLNVRAVCAGFNYRFGKNAKQKNVGVDTHTDPIVGRMRASAPAKSIFNYLPACISATDSKTASAIY